MRVKSPFLERLHLDNEHFLLTGRSILLVREFFDAIDVRRQQSLDDVMFVAFMKEVTDLSEKDILRVFDMLDVDNSGGVEFDEFYLLICMIIAIKDRMEKQFLWRHSRTCFELLDEDGSKEISVEEFHTIAIIFSISANAAEEIFKEFDVDGSKELDYEEFRLFALAAIDHQRRLDGMEQQNKGRTQCRVM